MITKNPRIQNNFFFHAFDFFFLFYGTETDFTDFQK